METFFPKNLRAAMDARGITQAELAKTSNLTQGAVSKYLSGRQEPKSKELCALAAALQTSMDALYSDVGPTFQTELSGWDWREKARDAERKLERLRRAFRKITDVVHELEGAI